MSSDLGSPLQGTVLIVDVEVGGQMTEGQRVVLLESMKMEYEVLAPSGVYHSSSSISPPR